MNTTCTWVEVSSIETSSVIHLRVTRSITANTAMLRAAGEMRAVVDPDRVAAVVRPLRERPALRADPPGTLQTQAVCSQNTPDGGRRDPHRRRCSCRGARACDASGRLAPALEQLEDRGDLLGAQAVHRGCPACGRRGSRHRAGGATATPGPRPARGSAQARRCSQPSATARSISSSSWCLVAASTRRGTRPLSPSALFPPPASSGRPSPSTPPTAGRSPPSRPPAPDPRRPGEPPAATPRTHPARPAWRPSGAS